MNVFNKPVQKMSEQELRFFKLEMQNAANSVVSRYANRGSEFLMGLSIALRDEAGKKLYAKNQPKAGSESDEDDSGSGGLFG